MQMFDKAEAEYRELSEKKRIVENDKEKIKKVGAGTSASLTIPKTAAVFVWTSQCSDWHYL